MNVTRGPHTDTNTGSRVEELPFYN